jgi:hypothetical protein
MTYQDKMRDKKQRAELIIPIVFVFGIFICSIVYGYQYKGLTFEQSIRKETFAFLSLIVLTSIGMVMAFACITAGKAIMKWRNNKKKDK